MTPPTENWR